MKRRIAAWLATATIAFLGLTACSGDDSGSVDSGSEAVTTTTEETSAAEEDTSSAAEETTAEAAEQTVAEACISMATPMAEAGSAIAEIASAATDDPQSAVDAWTELADAYATAKDQITNVEVKDAATAAYEDVAAVRDLLQKLYVDGDTSVLSEYTTAVTDMQESLTALNELCAN